MLSNVTIYIFHSRMTLYVNIMEHQGFFQSLKTDKAFIPQDITSTRLNLHEPKD